MTHARFLAQFGTEDSPDPRVMFAFVAGAIANGLAAQQKKPDCSVRQVFEMAYVIATRGTIPLVLERVGAAPARKRGGEGAECAGGLTPPGRL